jgi:hypothetical protein
LRQQQRQQKRDQALADARARRGSDESAHFKSAKTRSAFSAILRQRANASRAKEADKERMRADRERQHMWAEEAVLLGCPGMPFLIYQAAVERYLQWHQRALMSREDSWRHTRRDRAAASATATTFAQKAAAVAQANAAAVTPAEITAAKAAAAELRAAVSECAYDIRPEPQLPGTRRQLRNTQLEPLPGVTDSTLSVEARSGGGGEKLPPLRRPKHISLGQWRKLPRAYQVHQWTHLAPLLERTNPVLLQLSLGARSSTS